MSARDEDDWSAVIEIARLGDCAPAAKLLRSGEPLTPLARQFLADFIEGRFVQKRKKVGRKSKLGPIEIKYIRLILSNAPRSAYSGATKPGVGRRRIILQLSKLHGVSESTIRDVEKKRKTFAEN